MENRAIVIVKAGRADFADAAVDGIMAGREKRLEEARDEGGPHPALRATFPIGGRLLEETKRREVAHLVKVAVGNTKGPEDYAIMRAAAAQEYRTPRLSERRRMLERLLALYAMAWYRIREYFNWEAERWRGE